MASAPDQPTREHPPDDLGIAWVSLVEAEMIDPGRSTPSYGYCCGYFLGRRERR